MNQQTKREGFVDDQPAVEPVPIPPGTYQGAADSNVVEIRPEQPTWPIKVRLLNRPIKNNQGEEIRELSFREPTGGDINRYGNPVRIDQYGEAIIDEKKMTLIMSALTGILSPLLERMDPRDWNSCAYRLRSFFLPDPAAW